MDPSIKEYFSSPHETLSRTLNVLKFQCGQQEIIQKNFYELVPIYIFFFNLNF